MKRIDAIRNIMDTVTDEIVVTSAGRISREVFYVKDRPENFYVQGSMGATLGIGIGLALSKPEKKIIVIAGDGDVLMNLNNLVLLNKLRDLESIKNLFLFILDNNCYQTTGGQKTVSDSIDFRSLCDCTVVFCQNSEEDIPRISLSHKELKERFMEVLK